LLYLPKAAAVVAGNRAASPASHAADRPGRFWAI